ncbi:archaea-specific SMC-related protein [Natrialbaceae archaeon A-CW2]
MSSELLQSATLEVENIGGIDRTEVDVEPGITVLSGRNATNRTSLLQAFMAALGSERASLKADAEAGHAELELEGKTYIRHLERAGNEIRMDGEPYLEDAELADLFAFLLESNEARRTVTTQGDLRELVLRPVDTGAIEREIERLKSEKDEISSELDKLESLKRELPELEQERTQLEEKIAGKREELSSVQEAIEEIDHEATERSDAEDELDERLGELSNLRSSLEDVEFDIETERESLEALREDREELTDEKTELPASDPGAEDEIDEEIETLQSRAKSLDRAVRQLQDIVQFNEEMLEGTHPEVREALLQGDAGGAGDEVTDQLLESDDSVLCWTCGSEVDRTQIESTLEQMRSLHASKLNQQKDLEEQIRELRSRRRKLESTRERRRSIETRLDEISTEIVTREDRLESLQDRRDELEGEIDDVSSTVEELEAAVAEESDDDGPQMLELNKEANDLEFTLGRLERERESVSDDIDEIEASLAREETLEDRLESIRDELENQRTRIERIEREAVESFNEHMATVLEVLDYSNIERIWLERVERTVREGRRTVNRGEFDLHVIRSAADGRTYEDTIEHLSESEREVTGLIFALAGYLVHEVYEELPFVLLDSLESLDSDRIASLVEYFGEYCDYLVVALLPEDARALDDEHTFIESI